MSEKRGQREDWGVILLRKVLREPEFNPQSLGENARCGDSTCNSGAGEAEADRSRESKPIRDPVSKQTPSGMTPEAVLWLLHAFPYAPPVVIRDPGGPMDHAADESHAGRA